MPIFTIIETIPCVQQWTYQVEAETEEAAMAKVTNNTAEIVDSVTTEHDYEQAEYEVTEIDSDEEETLGEEEEGMGRGI